MSSTEKVMYDNQTMKVYTGFFCEKTLVEFLQFDQNAKVLESWEKSSIKSQTPKCPKAVFILPHIGTLEQRSWGKMKTFIVTFFNMLLNLPIY